MFKGEKVFKSERIVKYYYEKSYKKTNNLVIVFSAFSPIGKKPTYNFVRTLEGFDCNKLFILDDFGCRATYYLCENRDFSIERSVVELINFIIKDNDINNVITCGSSKGGYAALYYGIKYGFNHVIAASPQYLLGEYLLQQTNSDYIVEYMSGSAENDDRKFLNDIMSNVITHSKNKPNIFMHLGEGEDHYTTHVKPLLNKLKENRIDYQLDLGNYSKHSDVGKFFPPILEGKVREIFGYPFLKFEQTAEVKQSLNTKHEFKVITDSKIDKIAWYLYFNGKRIDMCNYSLNRTYNVTFNKKGKYQVKSFAINDNGFKVSIKSRIIEVS